jgi:hypothetical protein
MRGICAVLFVTFILSLTLLVFGGVRAYQVNFYWANPDVFAHNISVRTPTFDFSDVTTTHPRNSADSLVGSFSSHDGSIFFRCEQGLMSRRYGDIVFIPGATGMSALADDRVIVPGATPSFIVGSAGNGRKTIYFVDVASGGFIYSCTVNGEELTRISNHPALNLAVVGDFLFYTNVDDNHRLYRLDLLSENRRLVLEETSVFATLGVGSRLFYIAENNRLFVWDTASNEPPVQIARNAASTLRVLADAIFFINTDGQVQAITFDGQPIATFAPTNVRSYDITFNWLFFTEEGRHVPRAFNLHHELFFTLSTTEWVSYIWHHNDQILGIDHDNPHLVHIFNLPT